jgi:NADH:ubiquinone reductase (non-electrogenic)
VYDSSSIDEHKRLDQEIIPPTRGFAAFLLWRAAYWTRAVSISNKMLILMYWFKSAVFGRDISRF